METVRQLLEAKGHEVFTIAPDTSVLDAIRVMAEKGIGALAVLDGDTLVGIVSERDYTRKVILKGKSSESTKVSEVMTKRVVYVRPEQTVNDCMALMTEKRVRHLPVLQDDRLIGMLSLGDTVKSIISEQQLLIEQLENYIHS